MAATPYKSLDLWDEVCDSQDSDIRAGADGFSSVDVHAKVKKATSLWGPQGSTKGWKVRTVYTQEKLSGHDGVALRHPILVTAEVSLTYPGGKVEDIQDSAWLFSPQGIWDLSAKKTARSKALAKAFGQLGFNADVRLIQARHEDVDRRAEQDQEPGDHRSDGWHRRHNAIGEGDRQEDETSRQLDDAFDKSAKTRRPFRDVGSAS